MGKRIYNAKARKVVKTNIDNSQTSEIKLEFANTEYGASDASNLLALPSKKRQTNIVKEKKEKIRILSKQQRKKLEKIVEKKKKKENRAALLESLAQVQATPDEVKRLTGISAVQTIGLRRLAEFDSLKAPVREAEVEDSGKKFSSIAGAKKRLRLLKMESGDKKKKTKYDPNVVGLDESTDDSSEPESEDDNDDDSDNPEIIENGSHENIVDVDLSNPAENGNVDKTSKELNKSDSKSMEKKSNEKGVESNSKDDQGTKVARNINTDKKEDVVEIEETKEVKKPILEHPMVHVQVKRDPKIQVQRLKLPILGEEQRIMELVHENEFLIIAGETGSGKTTQVPQFLYEAGYAVDQMIAVTEPRRVATVAMSQRVGYELGLSAKEVSYLMRFEGNVTKDTKIKFMTDGVLLKEIQTDFLLSKYSVVIIDEAHERSVYTDILLGLLSRIVLLRKKRGKPLRLIVMSATLRVEDFTQNTTLFKQPPPVINIEARQFPVTVHFSRRTPADYLRAAYAKTVRIHTRLGDGAVLVFVTGQREVHYLVRKLKAAFPYRKDVDYSKLITKKPPADADIAALDSEPDDIESDDDEVEKEMKRVRKARRKCRQKVRALPAVRLDDYAMPADDAQPDLLEGGGDAGGGGGGGGSGSDGEGEGRLTDSDEEADLLAPEIRACRQPLWVLPLYSLLAGPKQARVFRPPPAGARLCVVSTDVAETSLTIPGVKYVVDTGKKKMKVYDHATGASAWRVSWAAQASAQQRAGRAGRTAPGHAYRLYSAAVFQHECAPHHAPDLCRRPVDELLLMMKCMGIDKVVNFPFPTAPDRLQLRLAERRLQVLGLLEASGGRKDQEEVLKVTPLGTAVSAFPILPRYGKMLALSHQHNLLPYAVALVAALTVPELMSGRPAEKWPALGNALLLGDPGVLLRAVGALEFAHAQGEADVFIHKYGLREKAAQEVRKLRRQLCAEIALSVRGADCALDPSTPPPDDNQCRLLRQLLLSGLGDQVGRKIALSEVKEGEDKRKYKYAYHCGALEEPARLHSDSILRQVIPEWVVYQELYETGAEGRRKMVMRGVCAVEPEWLPAYVPRLCRLGEPLPDPPPRYDERAGCVRCHFKGTFGRAGWELPPVELDFPDTVERYKWFGRFLLEGSVFPKLKKYTPSLLSPPSTMVKSWAKLQPRTELLLKALVAKRAGTRDSLREIWGEHAHYLLDEYLRWVPESAHNEVTLSWPPL